VHDSQSLIDEDLCSLSESVNISISNKEIFPNVIFTKRNKVTMIDLRSDKSIEGLKKGS
jgi:hypothetical protein